MSAKITGKDHIEFILMATKVPFEKEYKFLPDRKFAFDFCLPSHRIAIEYEGIFSAKSRHTTAGGYSGDATKYNLAVINGWRVLRYTAINYRQFYDDINQMLKK